MGVPLVRVATESDIPAMHRIRSGVHENRLTDPTSVQPEDYRALMEGDGRGWVAEVDGRIVGFAVGDRGSSNVWALFVEPGYEGRGAGRRLHDEMLEWLFATGAEQIWLGTDPGTRADRFYRAAGWRVEGRQPNGELRFELRREDWLALRSAGNR